MPNASTNQVILTLNSWLFLTIHGISPQDRYKRPFNTCFGVYWWDSWQIRSRFVFKPWINVSPNEFIIPTNAYESITIQLRCLRMHYELVTNQLRFFESGVRGQYFEQLQTFATNSRSFKNWKNWLRIQKNQLRTSRTDYDSTTNPNIYQFVAIREIRGLCGIKAIHNTLSSMLEVLDVVLEVYRIQHTFKHMLCWRY